jgi:hypothetical protein
MAHNSNIEYIVILRCKKCGDVLSLGFPYSYDEISKAIHKFYLQHQHNGDGPWVV